MNNSLALVERPFVELSRRFRELTAAELEDPEVLAVMSDHGLSKTEGWDGLLKSPRSLIFAEAGSGKTSEMQEQERKLTAAGNAAFFIPLESLDRESLGKCLSLPQERAFNAWREEARSPAWFFLDSVDELKLTQGTLERALRHFAREVEGLFHLAHVLISCRPLDWRPAFDRATVEKLLPVGSEPSASYSSSNDTFLARLRTHHGGSDRDKNAERECGFRSVALLPLGDLQIERFVRSLGVTNPSTFIAELRRNDALNFARRPLDLEDLVISWRETGQLGTRDKQHFANIAAKLKDKPDRPDCGKLTDERALLGAERLALALSLTQTRTIRTPEHGFAAERGLGVLDPAKVLPDYTEEERQTLLRRALFSPATYGRVRFHHRSVQEYLAARRLKALREGGMSSKHLCHFLFAEIYGSATRREV